MDELSQILKELPSNDECFQKNSWEDVTRAVGKKVDLNGMYRKHGAALVGALRKAGKLKGLLRKLIPDLALRLDSKPNPYGERRPQQQTNSGASFSAFPGAAAHQHPMQFSWSRQAHPAQVWYPAHNWTTPVQAWPHVYQHARVDPYPQHCPTVQHSPTTESLSAYPAHVCRPAHNWTAPVQAWPHVYQHARADPCQQHCPADHHSPLIEPLPTTRSLSPSDIGKVTEQSPHGRRATSPFDIGKVNEKSPHGRRATSPFDIGKVNEKSSNDRSAASGQSSGGDQNKHRMIHLRQLLFSRSFLQKAAEPRSIDIRVDSEEKCPKRARASSLPPAAS